jgi:hypothetical protein
MSEEFCNALFARYFLFDEDGKATFVCGRQLLFDEQTAFADV